MMKQEIRLEKLAGPQMPGWIGAIGSHGRVLSKEGAWSDLWFRRISAAREVSEREREIGDRETREGLSHVCLRGCENYGDRRTEM